MSSRHTTARRGAALAAGLLLALGGCASRGPAPVIPVPATRDWARGFTEEGLASWHGPSRFSRDARTASGRRWSNSALIAAHRTLPLGTLVRVTHLGSGEHVILQVTDRGPYVDGRIIDVSPRAADLLGFRGRGLARVRVEVIER